MISLQESACLLIRPGSLVGPIDLSRIDEDNLPTILQRICDEIQQLKTAFSEAEIKRKEDYAKILEAIEASKLSNTKTMSEYTNDAENLKTFMKICKFGIAHPWMTVAILVVGFAIIDYATRYFYWDLFPKP